MNEEGWGVQDARDEQLESGNRRKLLQKADTLSNYTAVNNVKALTGETGNSMIVTSLHFRSAVSVLHLLVLGGGGEYRLTP